VGRTAWHWIGWSLAAACLLPRAVLCAQPVLEYDLKAAFVYNFALFTDWPADDSPEGAVLSICVNAASALRQPLVLLNDKPVKGRKLTVRSFGASDTLRGCQVLVLDSNDRDRWAQIRKGLDGTSVLTVTDDSEMNPEGCVIRFAMEGHRVVFDVDTRAARHFRLVLSSKLLRLARTVQ
jgi:YfiR/HmsC-like